MSSRTPRPNERRIWAGTECWVIQVWKPGNEKSEAYWNTVAWYGDIAALAKAEVQQRAQGRVKRGMDIIKAIEKANTEVVAALVPLLRLVQRKALEIPSLQLSRATRGAKL